MKKINVAALGAYMALILAILGVLTATVSENFEHGLSTFQNSMLAAFILISIRDLKRKP